MLESILSYDYHPIIVHIPVAFFTVYALLEIVTAFFVRLNTKTIFYIKCFLVFAGMIGVSGALATGEVASYLNRDSVPQSILHAHEAWAEFTAGFFWIPIIIYVAIILNYERSYFEAKIVSWFGQQKFITTIFNVSKKLSSFFETKRWLLALIAMVGLIAVTVTGALGGAIVYSPNADPFIETVISLLGL